LHFDKITHNFAFRKSINTILMKRILILISLLMLFNCSLNAQSATYHSFPDSAMWRVDYDINQPFQFYAYFDIYFHYSLIGDTIINTKQYRKLYRSYYYVTHINVFEPGQTPQCLPPSYLGALRDDPAADKVFFVYDGTTIDSLLFDYTLQPGDTVKGIPGAKYDHLRNTVQSIDSVLIEGNYHRRWTLDTCYSPYSVHSAPYIIEGIGSSSGLIEVICAYAMDFTNRYLVCVKKDNNILFESGYASEFGCNPIIEGIDEDLSPNAIHCTNPNVAECTIQSDVYLQNATLTLINASGCRVMQMQNISGNSFVVTRNSLPAGIYFLQLNQSNKMLGTAKVVFTD